MPSSSSSLRQWFITDQDPDGIGTACEVIVTAGGRIERGHIWYGGNLQSTVELNGIIYEVRSAITFLVEEWDFDYTYTAPPVNPRWLWLIIAVLMLLSGLAMILVWLTA